MFRTRLRETITLDESLRELLEELSEQQLDDMSAADQEVAAVWATAELLFARNREALAGQIVSELNRLHRERG